MLFEDGERELEYALEKSPMIMNSENFSSTLLLIKVIKRLHRPSKTIERKASYEFWH